MAMGLAPPPLAAIYVRRSKGKDAKIPHQIRAAVDKAASFGFWVPASEAFRFVDDDTKGATLSRVGLDRMTAVSRSGRAPYQAIIVKDKSRFGRFKDRREHTVRDKQFDNWGTPLWYFKRGAPIDYANTPAVEALSATIIDVIEEAQTAAELEDIARRITGGVRDAVKDGFYPGMAPYGTERVMVNRTTREVIPIPLKGIAKMTGWAPMLVWAVLDNSAKVVKLIFNWLEEGRSLKWIARRLNATGEPCPLVRKGYTNRLRHYDAPRWHGETVGEIARNPIYKGELVWGRTTDVVAEPVHVDQAKNDDRTPIFVPDFIEPLVSPRQWAVVNRRLTKNDDRQAGQRASKTEYLLPGLLYCAACGGKLYGTRCGQAGAKRYYYKHGALSRPDSTIAGVDCIHRGRHIRLGSVEDPVLSAVRQLLQQGFLARAAAEAVDRIRHSAPKRTRSDPAAQVRTQMSDAQAALDKLIDLRAKTPEDQTEVIARYNIKTAELNEKLVGLRKRLAEHEATASDASALDEAIQCMPDVPANALELFERASVKDRKLIVRELIKRVTVDMPRGTIEIMARTDFTMVSAVLDGLPNTAAPTDQRRKPRAA